MYRVRFELFSGESGDLRLSKKVQAQKFIKFCFGGSLTGKMILQTFNCYDTVEYDVDGIKFKITKVKREV